MSPFVARRAGWWVRVLGLATEAAEERAGASRFDCDQTRSLRVSPEPAYIHALGPQY